MKNRIGPEANRSNSSADSVGEMSQRVFLIHTSDLKFFVPDECLRWSVTALIQALAFSLQAASHETKSMTDDDHTIIL